MRCMNRNLVPMSINTMTFAARPFWRRRGASDEHTRRWVCEERATKPAPKRTAARRVALILAWGVVARRLQPHSGGCALLAPSRRPKTAQRTSSYSCSSVLRCDIPFNHPNRGFTLIGLLVVLGAGAMLVLLLLPGLARSKSLGQEGRCLNNMRQLLVAAQLYADNNAGVWFPNQPGQDCWCDDPMSWHDSNPWPATNTAVPTWQYGTEQAMVSGYYSFFAPYLLVPSVYKCPADPSTADNGGPRCRTYSANEAVGTCWNELWAGCPSAPGRGGLAGGPVTGQWLSGSLSDCQGYGQVYNKVSMMNRPSPVNLWVFAEEHPDTINDSGLAVQIADVNPGGAFVDAPSNLHNGAGSFSFADGHATLHKWVGPILGSAPFVQGDIGLGAFPNSTATRPADLKDLNWLQSHTSAPVDPRIQYPPPQN